MEETSFDRPQWREAPFRPGRVVASGKVAVGDESATRRWVLDCPLWKWRIAKRYSRALAATTLGVGVTTLQSWEHGVYQPNHEHMRRLCHEDILGPDGAEEWAEWVARRPEIPRPMTREEAERILAERRAGERAAREGLVEVDRAAEETARQLEELTRRLEGEGDRDDGREG